jgi:uncharacterized membrane protein YphA (DoxX/SURF4 family)
MNILLWVLQAVLALLGVSGGAFKIVKIEDLKKGVASMRALPRGLWAFLGAVECLAGLGLLLPVGAPYAAAVMAVESLIVSALYIYYRDFPPLAYSATMAVMAAFIAYGRFVLEPFQ